MCRRLDIWGARPGPCALGATALFRLLPLLGTGLLVGREAWESRSRSGSQEDSEERPLSSAYTDEEPGEWDAWEALEDGLDCESVKMPYAKWCRIYVTTKAPPEGRGVVLLLVDRVFPHKATDGHWTAVDGKRRVQVINVRDRAKVTPRPRVNDK